MRVQVNITTNQKKRHNNRLDTDFKIAFNATQYLTTVSVIYSLDTEIILYRILC